jgi:hypothetical protein
MRRFSFCLVSILLLSIAGLSSASAQGWRILKLAPGAMSLKRGLDTNTSAPNYSYPSLMPDSPKWNAPIPRVPQFTNQSNEVPKSDDEVLIDPDTSSTDAVIQEPSSVATVPDSRGSTNLSETPSSGNNRKPESDRTLDCMRAANFDTTSVSYKQCLVRLFRVN